MTGASIVAPTVRGPEVRIARGRSVTEWWRSLPSGLEHGVTFDERPDGEGELILHVHVSGGASAAAGAGGSVTLRDRDGIARASYAHLYVADADGRTLDAALRAAGDHIEIRVDDRGAHYPIVVDPLLFAVEEATLRASAPSEFAHFGAGLAMDDAGGLIAVANASGSTVEIFARTGASWAAAGSIDAPGTSPVSGVSMAFSAAGDRLVVGTPGNFASPGGARVFVRSAGSWAEEAFLTDATACAGHSIGRSVAIDDAGGLIVLGAPASCFSTPPLSGEAFVFRRAGTTWTREAVLTPPDATRIESFGISTALSADGSRILVGAPSAAGGGLVRVYTFMGTWSLEATLAGAPGAGFGDAVGLDAAGERALVSSPSATVAGMSAAGRVQVYLRTGVTWAAEAALEAEVAAMGAAFGRSLAVSTDGARALVGNPGATTPGGVTAFQRTGTAWSLAGRFTPSDIVAGDQYGEHIAGSFSLDRAVVSAVSDDEPDGSGSARVLRWMASGALGAPCGSGAECLSDFCVDGVCCESACGGGNDTDCQACDAARTGDTDGRCLPLSASVAPTITCRGAAGSCDAPETCVAEQSTCPPDAYQPTGTVCRAAAAGMACDAVETCPGSSPECPSDGVASTGTACRDTTGACDPTESCDGVSRACPADVILPAGTECGGALPRSCTTPGVCDGVSGSCGGGTPLAAGTPCLARDPTNPCDIDDVCTAEQTCPDRWAPATDACGSPGGAGPCDAPDHCSGATGACVDALLVDVECRGSTGACDPAERCGGDSPLCPTDQVAPADLVCRASIDPTCDPVESCDGTSGACPVDVTECVPPDAPSDAGTSATDTGPPAAATGCGCRAGVGPTSTLSLVGLLALLAALTRRTPSAARRAWRGARPG